MIEKKSDSKETILVIEDSKEISDLILLHLEDNYMVHQVFDGQKAIEFIADNFLDLIILDLMLPIVNGYEVLKYIRSKSQLPVIILSAKGSDEDKIIGLQKGADDYLSKPFNPLELVARVNAQLRIRRQRDLQNDIIQIGELELNTIECCLYKNNI